MSNPEVDQLYNILNADAVTPATLEGLKDFNADTKNQLVARVAGTLEPPPSGKVLARLPLILTDQNKANMTTAFLVNLGSPYSDARKASLYGLQKLQYPTIAEIALNALRDNNDQVVAAACDLLLPTAKQDPQLWQLLQQLYALHKDDERFYLSKSLLEAHDILK